MLELDPILPTQPSNVMEHNREDFSSLFSDQSNFRDLINSFTENNYLNDSLTAISNNAKHIEFDNTSEHLLKKPNERKNTNLPPSQNSLAFSEHDHIPFSQRSLKFSDNVEPFETTFDKEFEKLEDMDFDIPFFEDAEINISEDEILAATEKTPKLKTTQTPRPLDFDLNKERKKKFQSQIVPKHNETSLIGNAPASCPNIDYERPCSSSSLKKNPVDVSKIFASFQSPKPDGSPTLSRIPESIGSFQSCNNSDSSLNNLSEAMASSQSSMRSQSPVHVGGIKTDEITNNIEGVSQIEFASKSRKNVTIDPSGIPEAVKNLYDVMQQYYSDFSFVYALSAQLCQDRIPISCFVNVKMSLLLSIASIKKNSEIAPIPIIVMGNDVYHANYLMTSIADLANRFVGPIDDTKPPSSDGFRNRKWIEADPIQLAKGGVFYVGDWSCIKTQRAEKIFKDIETSRVAVERTTKIYPLQTAIWTHWHTGKYNSKDQQYFNKFVKIFGIPVYMDTKNDEDLVDYILKQYSVEMFESTVDSLSISADDMRKFLQTISARTVDFSPEAIDLLQKYFVASRTERPDCLRKQAFAILKQYSESFAKLAMRHEVLKIDAIGAIFLSEHFIQHLYGAGTDPPPMLEQVAFVGYVDAYLSKFKSWLQMYITKYNEK